MGGVSMTSFCWSLFERDGRHWSSLKTFA